MNTKLVLITGALIFLGIALFANPQPAYAAVNCSDPGVVCKSGTLPGSETWTAGNIYVITGSDVIVPAGATLTIQAGVIVKLNAYYLTLIVDGNLVAAGTSGNRVYFTSAQDDTLGGDTNHDTTPPGPGQWDSIYFRGGSSGTLSHVEFRYGTNLIYMDGNTNVAVDHSLFKNAATCAINTSPEADPTLADMAPGDFTGSDYNGLCLRGETVDLNTTWDETEATYVLLNDVTLTSGFTLTWGPGIVLKPQAYYASLVVDGTLNANGTDSQPIYVTSFNDDTVGGQTNNNANAPGPGQWDSIYFRGGSSGTLSHVEFRYGTNLIYMDGNTNVAVDHSLFKNAATCAINTSPEADPTLADMAPGDFTGSDYNGLCLRGETVDLNTTWDETEATYVLLNDVTLTSGFTLTWGPGIVLKPQAYYASLVVDGTLNANGTDSQPIYVTSFNDDTVGGQTNNNANAPGPGQWDSIYFRGGSSGTLSHVEFRYGTNLIYMDGNTNVAVDHSLFKNAATCAINTSPEVDPTLADMAPGDFTGSDYNGLCLRGETVDLNTTWDETEATYVLLNDVTLTSGFTLTWGPGLCSSRRLTMQAWWWTARSTPTAQTASPSTSPRSMTIPWEARPTTTPTLPDQASGTRSTSAAGAAGR